MVLTVDCTYQVYSTKLAVLLAVMSAFFFYCAVGCGSVDCCAVLAAALTL